MKNKSVNHFQDETIRLFEAISARNRLSIAYFGLNIGMINSYYSLCDVFPEEKP
ncbi:hypothetical protein [Cyclobacterium amurskyense]|uniref:hypothetical protein n=1 Tax=Cyclobacterium amurskyense TaxID=320787 RepID=UPI0012F78485|nr:hypothetical protein [Cyclobacterium amurskyense]